MDCAILSGHRRIRPFGLKGGEAGELGRSYVTRLDGKIEELKGADQTVVHAGETITVITPTAPVGRALLGKSADDIAGRTMRAVLGDPLYDSIAERVRTGLAALSGGAR